MPGDVDGDRLTLELTAEDRGAIAAGLDWALGHHADLEHMLMLDPHAATALSDRLRSTGQRTSEITVAQAELLAIVLALALVVDGPLAIDPQAVTGLQEGVHRDLVTASSSIFTVWVAGGLRGSASTFTERDIVRIARASAAGKRDPLPSRIEHSFGTREAATRVADAGVVFSDTPSYLVAIRGRFCAPRAHPPSRPPRELLTRYAVQILVLDAASGQITDAGGGRTYPDLAQLGPVTTDFLYQA